MTKFPTLTVLLLTALFVAACGGGGPQRSESGDPAGAERPRAEATGQVDPGKTTPERSQEEAAGGGSSADEPSGFSVTTIEGEEITLGGGTDVAALYFMAGW